MTNLPVRLIIDTTQGPLPYSWRSNSLTVSFFPTHITRLGELQTGHPSMTLTHAEVKKLFQQVANVPRVNLHQHTLIEPLERTHGLLWRWDHQSKRFPVIIFTKCWKTSQGAVILLDPVCTLSTEQFFSFKAQYQEKK